jgi:hypothetical protein
MQKLSQARTRFVGRADELQQLKVAFEEAAAGQGSLIMLLGEPDQHTQAVPCLCFRGWSIEASAQDD